MNHSQLLCRIRTHLSRYNHEFAYAWIPHTNSNPNTNQSASPGLFMFYKYWLRFEIEIGLQFVPAASAAALCYCIVHMEWAINSLFMPTVQAFRPQKSTKTRCL